MVNRGGAGLQGRAHAHRRAPAPFIGARVVGEKSRPLCMSVTGVKVWAGEVVLSARRTAAARLAGRRGDRGRVARAGWGKEAVGEGPIRRPERGGVNGSR
jgi:hypothetical protein